MSRPPAHPASGPVLAALEQAVRQARANHEGAVARYIPELSRASPHVTQAAVSLCDGTQLRAGDPVGVPFTMQSSAKLVLLLGLLEERGPVEVFSRVGSEPSGGTFASIARLETHGPLPANPLINPGAIALAGLLEGSAEERRAWILRWAERLYGRRLEIDEAVFASELETADRNRAIAHYLRFVGILTAPVEATLRAYFALCSLSGQVGDASRLPALLANNGKQPGTGTRQLSPQTVAIVVSLMATCGMYNESGNFLVATGMPAKSGVSGVIVAVVPRVAGVAVYSPRLNDKGSSVRGHAILRSLSRSLGWHFALCPAPPG